jgi:hypothetical protein
MSEKCQMQTMARSERHRGLGYGEAKSHLFTLRIARFTMLGVTPGMTEAPCDRASRSLAQIHSRTALA